MTLQRSRDDSGARPATRASREQASIRHEREYSHRVPLEPSPKSVPDVSRGTVTGCVGEFTDAGKPRACPGYPQGIVVIYQLYDSKRA